MPSFNASIIQLVEATTLAVVLRNLVGAVRFTLLVCGWRVRRRT